MPYLKIHIVDGGTKTNELDGTVGESKFGHMWYEITGANGASFDFGFAPKPNNMNPARGPGEVKTNDNEVYHIESGDYHSQPVYITQSHYDKLKDFGENPTSAYNDFKLDYRGSYNDCTDFTWKALSKSGLIQFTNLGSDYEGKILPSSNTENAKKVIEAINSYDYLLTEIIPEIRLSVPSNWQELRSDIKSRLEQQLSQSLTNEAFDQLISSSDYFTLSTNSNTISQSLVNQCSGDITSISLTTLEGGTFESVKLTDSTDITKVILADGNSYNIVDGRQVIISENGKLILDGTEISSPEIFALSGSIDDSNQNWRMTHAGVNYHLARIDDNNRRTSAGEHLMIVREDAIDDSNSVRINKFDFTREGGVFGIDVDVQDLVNIDGSMHWGISVPFSDNQFAICSTENVMWLHFSGQIFNNY